MIAKIRHTFNKMFNAAGTKTPQGQERPVISASGFTPIDRSINAQSIKAALDIGPVQEILIPTARVAFPGYSIEIEPPDGEKPNEKKIDEAKRGLKMADKKINALKQMRLAWYDTTAYRHSFYNYTVKTDEGWTLPDTFIHMPADSFAAAPRSLMGNEQFYSDPLLQGYVVDRNDNSEHFYQSQTKTGEPIELDPETVLHIADETAGTASVLAGCVPTIRQWRFVREKGMMGYAQRVAAPNMVATVDLGLAELVAEKMNLPSADVSMGIPKDMWNYLTELIQKQSTDTAFLVPPGSQLSYPAAGVNPPIETDQYLKREIYTHLIPVTLLDTLGSSISKSSAPALEFFELVARGWREVCAAPFENFYNNLLEINGFEGYSCYLEFWDLKPEDEQAAHLRNINRLKEGVATINETRKEEGLEELDDAAVAALIDEHLRLQGAAGII